MSAHGTRVPCAALGSFPLVIRERAKLKFIAAAEDGVVMDVQLGDFYSIVDFGSDDWSRSNVSSV